MKSGNKFLFVMVDGGGNVPAMFDLVTRLISRGHTVKVLSEPCLQQPILELGAEFIPFEQHFTRTDRKEDLCQDWNATLFKNPTFDKVIFGPAETVIDQTIQAIQAHDIDLLLLDVLLFPALIAGEYMKIPKVLVFHMPEYMPGANRPPGNMGLLPGTGFFGRLRDRLLGKLMVVMFNKYKPLFNNIRKKLSLGAIRHTVDLIHSADLRLIQTLRSFDFPIEPSPKNVRYIGPTLDDPDWTTTWANPWPKDDLRPLVVISFSSTFQNQMSVLQESIDALSGLDVRGLATLGLAMEDQRFDIPENVVVLRSAPHSEVFPLADLVITHAGHGTVMRALANGLPLLCLPMGRDQNDNAAKVAFRGCGLSLSPKATAAEIRAAVLEILEQPKFREKAGQFKQELLVETDKAQAMLELEQLVVDSRSLLQM